MAFEGWITSGYCSNNGQVWSKGVTLEWSFNWSGVINSCHPGVPAPHDMSFVSTKEASKITREELDLGDEKCRRKATDSLKLFFLSYCFKVDLTAMGLWWVSALSFYPGYFSTGPIGPTEPRGCRMSSHSSSRVLECRLLDWDLQNNRLSNYHWYHCHSLCLFFWQVDILMAT